MPRRQLEVNLLGRVAQVHQSVHAAEPALERIIPAVRSAMEAEELGSRQDQYRIEWAFGFPVLSAASGDARNLLDFELRKLFAERAEDEDSAGEGLGDLAHPLEIAFLKPAVGLTLAKCKALLAFAKNGFLPEQRKISF